MNNDRSERDAARELRRRRLEFHLNRFRKQWKIFYSSAYGKIGFYIILVFAIIAILAPVIQLVPNPSKAMSLLNSTPGMKYINGQYYYNGKPFTMNIQITSEPLIPIFYEQALLIQQYWDAIGVKTTVTQEAFSTLVDNLITYNYQSIALGISGITGDPTGDYLAFYTPAGYGTGFFLGPYTNITFPNGTSMNGTQVTLLMEKLYTELNTNTNLTQRIAISNEIQGIAAYEANMINIGYGVDIFPIQDSVFVNVTNDTLGQTGFEYWNFMTVHMRSAVKIVTPTAVPIFLNVGVVPSSRIYFNGQYGNITIAVRNQYGQPVQGADLTIGVNPSGEIVNITSYSGVTNAQGLYTLEFRVVPNQPEIYTSDYLGEINITASATMSSSSSQPVVPGTGYAYIDIAPYPIAYKVLQMPTITSATTKYQPLKIEIYNPLNGSPVSGYGYEIQVNSGLFNITNSTDPTAFLSYLVPGNPAVDSYYSLINNSVGITVPDYNMTQISGVTPSNGTFTIGIKVNDPSAINFTAMGNDILSYIFMGNYYAAAPMPGGAPYQTIAELTSSQNPLGFGIQQPTEIPIQLTKGTPQYSIELATNTSAVAAGGTASVTVTVLNSAGSPVPNFTVDIVSQNVLGANRGYFTGSGTQIQFPNPNALFGSATIPGIQVTTNSKGTATVTFNSGIYTPVYSSGAFAGFKAGPFTDSFYIPADEFQISAIGMNFTADTTIYSNQMVNNAPQPVVAMAYPSGVGTFFIADPVFALAGNATYSLYINTTLGSAAGPAAGNQSFTVTATSGTLASTSGTTDANGTAVIKYTAPAVNSVTTVTITVSVGSTNYTRTLYILPTQHVVTTITKTVTKKVTSPVSALFEGLTALFAILFVVFVALFAMERRRRSGREEEQEQKEEPRTGEK